MNWKINVPEAIALAATVVSITLWAQSTFQSKEDAKEVKQNLDVRIGRLESEIVNIRSDISDISKDTQFIRGKMEGSVIIKK